MCGFGPIWSIVMVAGSGPSGRPRHHHIGQSEMLRHLAETHAETLCRKQTGQRCIVTDPGPAIEILGRLCNYKQPGKWSDKSRYYQ